MMKIEIEWKDNPIRCMESFNRKTCKLCKMERLAISGSYKKEKKKC